MKRIFGFVLISALCFAGCGSAPGRNAQPAFSVGDSVSVTGGEYAPAQGTVVAVVLNTNSYRVRLETAENPVTIRSSLLRRSSASSPSSPSLPSVPSPPPAASAAAPAIPVSTSVPLPTAAQPPVPAVPAAPAAPGRPPAAIPPPAAPARQSAAALAGTARRIAVLPIVGFDEYTAETIAWHLANQNAIHANFNVVPITPVIRKNVLNEQSYVSFFDAGEGVNADYIMASFSRTIGYDKIFFTVVLDARTRQQLAGDYRKYNDIQELSAFFPQMTKKIMTVVTAIAARPTTDVPLPKLSVELMAVPPKGINKSDAAVLTQLFAIQVANTNKYSVFPRIENIDAALIDYEKRRADASKTFVGDVDLTPTDFVLSSKIAIYDSKNEILAEIIGIENDVLKKGAHIEFNTIEETPDILNKLAAQLTSAR